MQSVRFSPGILYWLDAPSKPSTGESSSPPPPPPPSPPSWSGCALEPSRKQVHWPPSTNRARRVCSLGSTLFIPDSSLPGQLKPDHSPRGLFSPNFSWLFGNKHKNLFSPSVLAPNTAVYLSTKMAATVFSSTTIIIRRLLT